MLVAQTANIFSGLFSPETIFASHYTGGNASRGRYGTETTQCWNTLHNLPVNTVALLICDYSAEER